MFEEFSIRDSEGKLYRSVRKKGETRDQAVERGLIEAGLLPAFRRLDGTNLFELQYNTKNYSVEVVRAGR
jgi:hypothetical protein